jgi:hypothetical protein
MKVVCVITEPEVIDRILKHTIQMGDCDPFEGGRAAGGRV